MQPVVLLVGRLPDVIGDVARQLDDLPIQWLAAFNREEVLRQLAAEPKIEYVIMGSSHDDATRGELVAAIASARPDLAIHLKDRAPGPAGMAGFVRRLVENDLLQMRALA